jgi:hypothetical protein
VAGHDNFDNADNILFEHFMTGPKTASSKLTTTDQIRLDQMLAKLTSLYGWNETVPLNKLPSAQSCSDMLILTKWKSGEEKKFYDARQTATDYGSCCLITPYLDFENSKNPKNPNSYTGKDYNSIPRGTTRNGVNSGLDIMLDIESYDYAFFLRYDHDYYSIWFNFPNNWAAIVPLPPPPTPFHAQWEKRSAEGKEKGKGKVA